MFVFIDESGDTGMKIDKGASRFFILSAVVFHSKEEMQECDNSITNLKKLLQWSAKNNEFHFNKNSDKVRQAFFQIVRKERFTFSILVVDKTKLSVPKLGASKDEIYQKYCIQLLENIQPALKGATIIIDDFSNIEKIAKGIKDYFNKDSQVIEKIKTQKSSKNNLLQLADYIAAAVGRDSSQSKRESSKYFNLIKTKQKSSIKIP